MASHVTDVTTLFEMDSNISVCKSMLISNDCSDQGQAKQYVTQVLSTGNLAGMFV